MKTIEIKNRYTNEIIHTFTTKNATIKDAVENAIQNKKSLENANLKNANLKNASLENANLKNANLENTNLDNASLENANLKNANLINTNLKNADLKFANLTNADLEFANVENADIPMYCKWAVSICGQNIQIGCKIKPIEEWDIFFDSEKEFHTKRGTKEFKQIYAYYLGAKAYLKELNN